MIMKIVFYGIPEEEVRRLAGRYGFGLCRSFGEFVAGGGRKMLLQPLLRTDGERLDFFRGTGRRSMPSWSPAPTISAPCTTARSPGGSSP